MAEELQSITHRFIKTNGINMHIAEAGSGPVVLLLHGFPDFWFTWRYQIPALAKAGFHAIAPDIRGFGQTDVPVGIENYTIFHITGDLIGLIDALGEEKVFVVGHDWGAEAAWGLALFRPDRVNAVVTLSVPYTPRSNKGSSLSIIQPRLGGGWYMGQFQRPEYPEAEINRVGLANFLRETLLSSQTTPLVVPEGKTIGDLFKASTPLTSWFTAENLNEYVAAFEKSGLTGPLNVYRSIQRTWELQAPFTKTKVVTPALFIAGTRDIVWHVPGIQNYVKSGGLRHFVPNLRKFVVLDSGHFIQQEKHEEVNDLLIKFLHNELNLQSRL